MTSIDIVKRYIGAYETGNQQNVNVFLHPSYAYYPPGAAKPMNRDERIEDERYFFSAFSNIQTSVEDAISQGEKVACRVRMNCSHTGLYQGIPATNKRVTITYIEFLLLRDRKILKEWAEFDLLGIINQLRGTT